MPPRPPNVLIFCADEMRAGHMGCAGNRIVRTPNLDRLAARGTRFTRAYCNNPICMPARASMFTGLLPRDHGLRTNGQSLSPDIPALPAAMRAAGYRTHAAGKLHLTPWVPKSEPPDPNRFPECMDYWSRGVLDAFPTPYHGFESVDFVGGHTAYAYGDYIRWLRSRGGDPDLLRPSRALRPPTGAPECFAMAMPEELHYNRYIADSTIDLIRASSRDPSRPFFAWCSFPDPHAPLAPPEPFASMYDPGDVGLPSRRPGEIDCLPPFYRSVMDGSLRPNGVCNTGVTDDHWREMLALTYGMVTHMDAEIGRVMDALRDSGLQQSTVVVFITDHGDMMGDHGLLWKAFYTFDGCIRLPLLVSAPGQTGGRSCDALVSQVDLMPTILDLCGIAQPGAERLAAETPFSRGAIRPLQLRPGRSWRGLLDGSERPGERSRVVIENDDPTTGLCVRALVTARYRLAVYPGTEHGELFDLEADPGEVRNLWYEATGLRDALARQLLEAYSMHTPAHPVPPWNS